VTRIFNIKRKLAGIFMPRSTEDQMKDLQFVVNESAKVEKLYTGEDWPVVEKLLKVFHDGALREMSNKGISTKAMERVNHRLEFIKDFKEEVERILRDGSIALTKLTRLKEKEDDRREPERKRSGSVNTGTAS